MRAILAACAAALVLAALAQMLPPPRTLSGVHVVQTFTSTTTSSVPTTTACGEDRWATWWRDACRRTPC